MAGFGGGKLLPYLACACLEVGCDVTVTLHYQRVPFLALRVGLDNA